MPREKVEERDSREFRRIRLYAARGGGGKPRWRAIYIRAAVRETTDTGGGVVHGKHASGYIDFGLIIKLTGKLTLYAAYQVGNAGVTQGNHQFLWEVGYNFNLICRNQKFLFSSSEFTSGSEDRGRRGRRGARTRWWKGPERNRRRYHRDNAVEKQREFSMQPGVPQ